MALGRKEGFAHIDDRPGIPSQFRTILNTGIEVPTFGLEQMLDRCDWGTADLLKIDIEGSEYETLLAATPNTLSRIRRIAMEYHPRADNQGLVPDHLFAHLDACEFQQTFHRADGGGYGMALFSN